MARVSPFAKAFAGRWSTKRFGMKRADAQKRFENS